MAKSFNTRPNADAQFFATGYIVSEDNEFALRDLFEAQRAIADAYDQISHDGEKLDINGSEIGSILRSFSRLGQVLVDGAPYTCNAKAKKTQKKEAAS